VASTSNADSPSPDAFTFAILDSNSNEIPTTNANGLNSLVELDLPATGTSPAFMVSGTPSGAGVVVPAPLSPCDINKDSVTNVSDVQRITNEALGVAAAVDDLNGDGAVNVADVQIVVNAALGESCAAT
jgi:hypothetical protein